MNQLKNKSPQTLWNAGFCQCLETVKRPKNFISPQFALGQFPGQTGIEEHTGWGLNPGL